MKAVNSLIFVGGFGSTPESMSVAATSLGNYFEDVSIVSLREATGDFNFARRIDGHPVLTHSAGMLALEGSQPESVYSVAPPSPTKAGRLVTSSLVKSYHLLNRCREFEDEWPVGLYMRETAKEIALHPIVSTKLLGQISVFSAVHKAIELERIGVKTEIHQMTRDDFFRPIVQNALAVSKGLGPSVIDTHEGEHDELLVRPHNVVDKIFG